MIGGYCDKEGGTILVVLNSWYIDEEDVTLKSKQNIEKLI